ncbi:hypothetical protein VCHC32A1_0235, partial [Vibrio cholerae HC-32A1]
MRLLLGNT